MASIDFLLESEYDDQPLRIAIASILQVRIDDVIVIHDVSEYPHTQKGQVVCIVQRFTDGFRQCVTIDSERDFDVDNLVNEIAQVSRMRCLVPANEPNPYAMRLFSPNGEISLVYVDAFALDNRDIYILR